MKHGTPSQANRGPKNLGRSNGIGSSNCCSKPKCFAILASYSHLSVKSSAISCTLPRCLLRAIVPISFKN